MSSLELERDLRRFGKPITMFFHVVSVAARDYAFEKSRYDPGGGLAAPGYLDIWFIPTLPLLSGSRYLSNIWFYTLKFFFS